MKLNHTPLGTLVSKRKIIASVAALALVGSIAPTFINNTHAEEDPYFDPDETIFAPVGPDYISYIYDELHYYNYNNYSINIADTSVADFLIDDDVYCGYAECLQGKKIGSTEIVLEKAGEDTVRIPVRSVVLTPESYEIRKAEAQTITGSIEGADNSLLEIRPINYPDYVRITPVDARSLSISFPYGINNSEMYVDYNWKIGKQSVYSTINYNGYSTIYFMPIEGIDNVYHLPENEEILEDATLNALKGVYKYTRSITMNGPNEIIDPYSFGNVDITLSDGSIFHLNTLERRSYPYGYEPYDETYQGILDFSDLNTTESMRNKLKAELPDGAKDIQFKDAAVTVNYRYKLRESWGGDVNQRGGAGSSSNDTSDYYYQIVGYFKTLANPLTMAIDVSDIDEAEEGYTRTWYVVRDNDGTIENVEASFDEDTKTMRFEANVFGPHAYGYVDKGEEAPAPAVPNTGSPIQKVAKTAAITFAPLAAIAFGAFVVRNRKKAANKLAKKHNHFE